MKINFAIIGCGRIGQRHAEYINKHPEAELTATFDVLSDRSEALAKPYNKAKAFDSLATLLADEHINMVNVCTPNGTHATISIEALKAGKSVLVEKPMTIAKQDGEAMIKQALNVNQQLFVVKQNRFNPPVVAVKQLMDEEKLGKIYAVEINCFWNRNEDYYKNSDWKGTKELDGGTLFTQYSHFIDIAYYLFGDIEVISGITQNCNHQGLIEFEDTGHFLLRFKDSGAQGSMSYTTSCYEQNMEGSITIFAENATIKIGGKYLNTIDYQKTNGFDITDLPASGPANNYGHYQGSMSNHDKIIHNVVETLNNRQQIMTNAYDGLKVVEIIENMYKVAKFHN